MCQLIGNEPPAPQVEPQGQCHREGGGGGGGALTLPSNKLSETKRCQQRRIYQELKNYFKLEFRGGCFKENEKCRQT